MKDALWLPEAALRKELHLHDDALSVVGCAEQVKCTIFVGQNQAVLLFIERAP